MAFGKKQQEIERLTAQFEAFEKMPYIEDAKAINDEIAHILQHGNTVLSTSEVALRAIEIVRHQRHDKVFSTLAEEYSREHEARILDHLIQELRDKEGEQIRCDVEQSLRVNPSLQSELAERARYLLVQEAAYEAQEKIKHRLRHNVEQDLARQDMYNQYSVDFSLQSHIDLSSDTLKETYQEGDLLAITHMPCDHEQHPTVYAYTDDDVKFPTWRYVSGNIQGARYNEKLSNSLQLYRIGSLKPGKWKEKPTKAWDTLHAERQIHVSFHNDKTAYNDTLRTECCQTDLLVNQVLLLTPLAYEQHKEQQQY